MKLKRSILLSFIGVTLLLGFINCGQTAPGLLFSQSEDKKLTDDNGRPYDGKIYIVTGAPCPDGTTLRSRIVVQSPSSAELVRQECVEITPVALAAADFQLNPNNSSQLQYKNQIFTNTLVGTQLDMSLVSHELQNCYIITYDFGTPADTTTLYTQSLLQIYEDGKPLGPAHAAHADIRATGLGLFSYWMDTVTSAVALRFSASDNSDPLTNGRVYTWDIKQ
jgi:hypothetical protein